ncbi:alpha/beta hydrolase [Streptomyces misionensis]|uniref:alpha/beta hydrolase n=1 Tax=Streptomyces TaxID=1883 RepID=UPI003680E01F
MITWRGPGALRCHRKRRRRSHASRRACRCRARHTVVPALPAESASGAPGIAGAGEETCRDLSDGAGSAAALPGPGGGRRRRPVLHPETAAGLAARWEARRHLAGAYGHLNSASGLGAWPYGRELLDSLVR